MSRACLPSPCCSWSGPLSALCVVLFFVCPFSTSVQAQSIDLTGDREVTSPPALSPPAPFAASSRFSTVPLGDGISQPVTRTALPSLSSPRFQAQDRGPWVPSLRTLGQDALNIAQAPFELSANQQLQVLGAGGLVIGLMATADRPTNQFVHRQSGHTAAQVTGPLAGPGRWYDRVGPDRFALGTAGVLATGGLLMQNRHWTRTSVRVAEALVYTKLVTSLGKGLFSRTRPFASDDPFQASPGAFTSSHDRLSMPSGHTARAFAVASVLAHEFEGWYVEAPAYAFAASVGLERIRSGDHWLSDVVVGGTLGYLIGRSVSSTLPQPSRFSYRPVLSPDRIGLRIQF